MLASFAEGTLAQVCFKGLGLRGQCEFVILEVALSLRPYTPKPRNCMLQFRACFMARTISSRADFAKQMK